MMRSSLLAVVQMAETAYHHTPHHQLETGIKKGKKRRGKEGKLTVKDTQDKLSSCHCDHERGGVRERPRGGVRERPRDGGERPRGGGEREDRRGGEPRELFGGSGDREDRRRGGGDRDRRGDGERRRAELARGLGERERRRLLLPLSRHSRAKWPGLPHS